MIGIWNLRENNSNFIDDSPHLRDEERNQEKASREENDVIWTMNREDVCLDLERIVVPRSGKENHLHTKKKTLF